MRYFHSSWFQSFIVCRDDYGSMFLQHSPHIVEFFPKPENFWFVFKVAAADRVWLMKDDPDKTTQVEKFANLDNGVIGYCFSYVLPVPLEVDQFEGREIIVRRRGTVLDYRDQIGKLLEG